MNKYILYVECGTLPRQKAEEYIRTMVKTVEDFLGSDSQVLGLAVRQESTRLVKID
jgi:hypothetical protein